MEQEVATHRDHFVRRRVASSAANVGGVATRSGCSIPRRKIHDRSNSILTQNRPRSGGPRRRPASGCRWIQREPSSQLDRALRSKHRKGIVWPGPFHSSSGPYCNDAREWQPRCHWWKQRRERLSLGGTLQRGKQLIFLSERRSVQTAPGAHQPPPSQQQSFDRRGT